MGENGRRAPILCAAACGILLSAASTAAAGTLSLEAGRGFHHSQHVEALFLRYQIPAFTLFEQPAYYEALAGAWNGANRNEVVALSLGIEIPWHEDDHFFGSAGIGRASNTTANLGVHFQFTFHVGYAMKVGAVNVSAGYVHFSTGKYFLGWDGPNYGENFFTVQAGTTF